MYGIVIHVTHGLLCVLQRDTDDVLVAATARQEATRYVRRRDLLHPAQILAVSNHNVRGEFQLHFYERDA